MTTLTIEIPDSATDIISKITDIIKTAGGRIEVDNPNDDLTTQEFELLQESYREALLIKAGIKNAIPASELWND